MKRNFIMAILVGLSIGYPGTSLFAQDLNTAKLDSFINLLSVNNKAMGSIALSKNGKIVYSRSFGFGAVSDMRQTPATMDTRYRIGSITKMFTAAMTLQLVEEGKLSLDTKLEKFYPEIPNAGLITIQSLLNHKSGLYDFVSNEPQLITTPQNKETFFDIIKKGTPTALPDKVVSYSNSGYLLLANIIEKVTNQTYQKNLQDRICKKLALYNTYSPVDNNLKSNEAGSFSLTDGKWQSMTDIYFPNVTGVGDILSTPADIIRFNESLLSGKVISDTSLKLMKTYDTNTTEGMAMMKIPFYEKTAFGHTGDTFGTHSVVSYFPDDAFSFAACINGSVYPFNDISIGILSIAFNRIYKLPNFNSSKEQEKLMMGYVGNYSSKEIPLKIAILFKDNNLFAQASGQAAFALEAGEKGVFSFAPAGITIQFNPDGNGFTMKQGNLSYVYSKDK